MSISSSLPPLIPKVDAILILDGEGNRLAGKYYGDFLTKNSQPTSSNNNNNESNTNTILSIEDQRKQFEHQLHNKIQGIAARPDAAEVVTVMGKTAVFCGGTSLMGGGTVTSNGTSTTTTGGGGGTFSAGGDVRVVHVGSPTESELLLAYLCEGMYDALSHLMGGQNDRAVILDNLELVFLLIDEHCDGGIILEVEGMKLAGSVLLKEAEREHNGAAGAGSGMHGSTGVNGGSSGGMPMRPAGGDMTIAQAFRQAREQLIAGLNQGGM